MPPAKVWRVAKCVRFGAFALSSVRTPLYSPLMMWQVRQGTSPMWAMFVTSSCPRDASPPGRSESSYFTSRSPTGSGVCGSVYGGILSSGKTYPVVAGCTDAAGAGFAARETLIPATDATLGAATGAAASSGDPAAFSFWCAAQLSKSAGATVNTWKRMFACDEPQYSVQNPLNTLPARLESGVYQM